MFSRFSAASFSRRHRSDRGSEIIRISSPSASGIGEVSKKFRRRGKSPSVFGSSPARSSVAAAFFPPEKSDAKAAFSRAGPNGSLSPRSPVPKPRSRGAAESVCNGASGVARRRRREGRCRVLRLRANRHAEAAVHETGRKLCSRGNLRCPQLGSADGSPLSLAGLPSPPTLGLAVAGRWDPPRLEATVAYARWAGRAGAATRCSDAVQRRDGREFPVGRKTPAGRVVGGRSIAAGDNRAVRCAIAAGNAAPPRGGLPAAAAPIVLLRP